MRSYFRQDTSDLQNSAAHFAQDKLENREGWVNLAVLVNRSVWGSVGESDVRLTVRRRTDSSRGEPDLTGRPASLTDAYSPGSPQRVRPVADYQPVGRVSQAGRHPIPPPSVKLTINGQCRRTYGRISIVVLSGVTRQSSSISSSVRAMQPAVQSFQR